MKKTLLSITVLGLAAAANAQVMGNYAPDFTVTALNNGQATFNLYTELDAGKPVVLDVSATWCNPCWNYHQTHKLENLYTQYGPTGTNELRVIWVDGDNSTTDANMNGVSGPDPTQGNWLAGVSYPMANPASANAINSGYGITAFPTLILICPNRTVERFSQSLTAAQIYAKAAACPVATQPTDAAVFAYKGDVVTCSDLPVKVTIQNMGTTDMTSATITAKKGATVLGTQNWTGTLAKYAATDVDMGNLPFGATSGNLTIEVTTAGDANAANGLVNKPITTSVDQQDNKFDVKVKLDGYANEVKVVIKNSAGAPVFTKQYASADNNKTYTYKVELDVNECYTMRVTDSYGDGLENSGYIKLTKQNGTDIFTANGVYTQKDYALTPKAETAGWAGIEENASGDLFSVYPNPASEMLNTSLTLTSAEKVNFRIVNAQGQTVMIQNVQMTAGTTVQNFDVSGLAAGIYTLQITAGGQVSAKAFVKQ